MRHHIVTVTQEGMTPSQPGTSVGTSHTSGTNVWILSVKRHYQDCRPYPAPWNPEVMIRWKIKRLDGDGLEFPSSEAASAYALEHGYTQQYFTSPELRARRKANRAAPRHYHEGE